ncbi:hypothetical protein SH1V18_19650 [Vallitalea longa]|uniref:Methyltransferase domain-containing protein n=1 Tax=Vallitalea longa TaxID=2936439 RepID=A0A9W5Y922_9FIRM|nr:class I SAM-dependent methyltransferase [Vallitalea longa]GKX29485.1 hypothetical protein SH1V18_19650 [Vallitalea longa]
MNPWLTVPHDDYERHMKDTSVYQLQELNKIFKKNVERYKPKSILVLGCTGGNCFEHIDDRITKKVIGVDINKSYLDICRSRFKTKNYDLELICCDMNEEDLKIDTIDFISCALFLEYVDCYRVLSQIKKMMRNISRLNIVIQRSNDRRFVSNTGVSSLNVLSSISKEVIEKELEDIFDMLDMDIECKENISLPNGKEFITYICILKSI